MLKEFEIGHVKEYIDSITDHWNHDCGRMTYEGETDKEPDWFSLELVTGGWADNEEIIGEIMQSMFWVFYWQESRRGGYYLFGKEKA